jgi:hypothetical protein
VPQLSPVNGKVPATIMRTAPQKPMAFTAINGVVDVMCGGYTPT